MDRCLGRFSGVGRDLRSVVQTARTISVVEQVGAITIPMKTDSLKVIRVKTDPVFVIHEQKVSECTASVVFDSLEFVAHTVLRWYRCRENWSRTG